MKLTLTLPLSPSLNRYYKHFAGLALSKEGESFRSEAGWIARAWWLQHPEIPGELLTGELDILIELVMKGGDVDNREKALFDALNNTLWQDDDQIIRMTVEKRLPFPKEAEHITIDVREHRKAHSWNLPNKQPRWTNWTCSGSRMRRARTFGTNA